MSQLHNLELLDTKRRLLESGFTDSSFELDIKFYYHDIVIEIHTDSHELVNCIHEYFPKKWLEPRDENSKFVIQHYSPQKFSISSLDFENEESQDCLTERINDFEYAFQRDFAAKREISNNDSIQVKAIFDSRVDDGFFNFFRWLICRELIRENKAILHSSTILGKDGKAYVFLGPSGAGKTTTCINAEDRLILGDDMNALVIKNGKAFMQAGSIGGRFEPQVAIDDLFEIKGFYWLKQSNKLNLTEVSKAKANQLLLVSLANIFWDNSDPNFNEVAAKLCEKVTLEHSFYELELQNNTLFWNLVESSDFEMRVSGQSMYPTLKNQQSVTVKKSFKLEQGAIYLYLDHENKITIHRLIDDQKMIFKGDNSLVFESIEKDQIIGMVVTPNTSFPSFSASLSKLNSINSPRLLRIISRLLLRLTRF